MSFSIGNNLENTIFFYLNLKYTKRQSRRFDLKNNKRRSLVLYGRDTKRVKRKERV